MMQKNEKKEVDEKSIFKLKSYSKIHPNININKIPNLFVPATMGTYYNFPKIGIHTINGTTFNVNDTGVKIGIVSFGGSYNLSDLKTYWTNNKYYYNGPRSFNSNGSPINVNFISVDGAKNSATKSVLMSDGASIENMLDLSIIGALCPNAIINMYFAPNSNKGLIDAITQACQNNNIVSISWGNSEIAYDTATLNSVQNIFALYPKTIVCVASGDNGSNDGIGYFFPCSDFPSSSPNVIACGGSSLASKTSETAWSWNSSYKWGGGGAASLYFKKNEQSIPNFTYGQDAVGQELNYLFTNNRTTPDIAFNADPFSGWTILINGRQINIGGTSAVAPFMAGYMGLIYSSIPNVINALSSKNPISNYLYKVYNNSNSIDNFVNPFNDITVGTNANVWVVGQNYFNAISGYDLCTGLGSFNGINLLYYLSKY